jgi:hypothetical protein
MKILMELHSKIKTEYEEDIRQKRANFPPYLMVREEVLLNYVTCFLWYTNDCVKDQT